MTKSFRLGRIAQLESRAAIFFRDALVRMTPASVAMKQFKQVMRFDPAA